MVNEKSRPKPFYPVWLTLEEVKQIYMIRDTYSLLGSVVSKIESSASPKETNDPVRKLMQEYEDAEKLTENTICGKLGESARGAATYACQWTPGHSGRCSWDVPTGSLIREKK